MKYLMAPICTKYDDLNRLHVRRALVSFKKTKSDGFGGKIYLDTRLVAVDDYFKNEDASHTYKFYDEGFALVDCKHPDIKAEYEAAGVLGKIRPYHTLHLADCLAYPSNVKAVFKAKNDMEAVKIFKERDELR